MHSIVSDKVKFIELVKHGEVIPPVFQHPEWLTTVSGEDWDAYLIYLNDALVAFFSFTWSTKWGIEKIGSAAFTQFQGIHYINEVPDYSGQKKVIDEVLKILKDKAFVQLKLNPYHNYSLPYEWEGYSISRKTTYYLETDIQPLEAIRVNYKSTLKRNIKKGHKELVISQYQSYHADIYRLFTQTFVAKDMKVPFSRNLFEAMVRNGLKNDYLKVLRATDDNENLVALIVLVRDNKTMYYLGGGMDFSYKNNGAIPMLMDHAIAAANEQKIRFDFEGSSIASIERFFRSFGATYLPYNQIMRIKNPVLRKIYQLIS